MHLHKNNKDLQDTDKINNKVYCIPIACVTKNVYTNNPVSRKTPTKLLCLNCFNFKSLYSVYVGSVAHKTCHFFPAIHRCSIITYVKLLSLLYQRKYRLSYNNINTNNTQYVFNTRLWHTIYIYISTCYEVRLL